MFRGYKYRIYPNKQQTELIEKHFGCTRLVYNLALQIKNEAYRTQNKYLSAFDLCRQLPDLKKEFTWLQEVDSQALRESIIKLDIAFKNFFKYKKGFPKYKNKYDKQSYQHPNNTRRINWNENTLDLPKIKGIPIVLSRTFKGKIKTVTISRTPTNKYFASILVDTGVKRPKKAKIKENTTIGIDLGLNHFIITSDGIKVDNPRYLREAMGRLKVLQCRASKKVKGGQNRRKANLRVALQHENITNKRDDYLHKLSHKLTHDNQVGTICAESLNISGMVKNHHLAQAISDVSWAKFLTMLEYKCNWYGKNFVKIDRFEPSSKLCSDCGSINETLTLKDREWFCANCGTLHDRDINAAKNIKAAGLKKLTSEGIGEVPVELPALAGAVKQECPLSRAEYQKPCVAIIT